MERRRRILGLVTLTVSLITPSLWAPIHAANTSIPPANQKLEGPQATLERFADGYRRLSADDVIANMTVDYRFHALGDSFRWTPEGSNRDAEAKMLRNMLNGIIENGDTVRAPADSVGLVLDGFREAADPEHPDSTQHYRVVEVQRFDFGIKSGHIRMWTRSREHVFYLVRGDVAQLVAGQSASKDRWYIRRWIEDVAGIREQLEREKGGCGEPAVPNVGPASRIGSPVTALAIRPLINPACAKLEVTCALPGAEPARVEVFDVSGRLVNRRQVPVTGTGEVTIEAGKGATIIPGVYWVRLTQAARRPSTRMVVVAR